MSPPDAPCERCGTFAPPSIGVRHLCDACSARRTLSIDETPATTGRLVRESFVLLRALHVRALVPVFLLSVPFAFVHAVWEVPEWAQASRELVEVIADVALVYMTCALVDGDEPRIGSALALAARRWPILVVTVALSYLAIALGFVALIVPGVILSLGLVLAPAVAGLEGAGPVAAIRQSWTMMQGYKASLFWAYFTLGAAGAVVSALIRAVEDAIWALPAWYELSESVSLVLSYALSMFFTIFVYSVVYLPQRLILPVLYAKLRWSATSASLE